MRAEEGLFVAKKGAGGQSWSCIRPIFRRGFAGSLMRCGAGPLIGIARGGTVLSLADTETGLRPKRGASLRGPGAAMFPVKPLPMPRLPPASPIVTIGRVQGCGLSQRDFVGLYPFWRIFSDVPALGRRNGSQSGSRDPNARSFGAGRFSP